VFGFRCRGWADKDKDRIDGNNVGDSFGDSLAFASDGFKFDLDLLFVFIANK